MRQFNLLFVLGLRALFRASVSLARYVGDNTIVHSMLAAHVTSRIGIARPKSECCADSRGRCICARHFETLQRFGVQMGDAHFISMFMLCT